MSGDLSQPALRTTALLVEHLVSNIAPRHGWASRYISLVVMYKCLGKCVPLDEVEGLIDSVVASGLSLERFQTTPPPPRNIGTSHDVHTGGRPRHVLDLDWAIELHVMGNPWDAVADALGVCRHTLYYHLERAGLSPERPAFTEMDDETLDEHVAEISLKHPLAGKSIVQGHPKVRGLHIPVARVQESLWRVDAIGVIVR
ncbi:Ethylene-and jasmonate-responsive plant defensin [Mycena sanguinolenta]|uniref:Ethylene-and jasmonate-responsive plant defensin n=1 Tax=Mycena sanguinolenta TaxID=230812 RepID=A0A8H6ZGV0_9AGAR|nr:Ethylene-and jasmonate-responsive plant defensin [Mycena sanguinolenta]